MMVDVPIPEPGADLAAFGADQVFLEYDPLSQSVSKLAAASHMALQFDRRNSEFRSSIVPFPGVRGAWVIQCGELYWCRLFRRNGDHIAGTRGHAFGFDPQFGWTVKEGPPGGTADDAIETRAERAALYLMLGIAEQMKSEVWRLEDCAGSPYFRLRLLKKIAPMGSRGDDNFSAPF